MGYSKKFRAACMTKLSTNKNNYEKVSEDMGVSVRTLYRWQSKDDPELSEFLEDVVKELLDDIPSMAGKDYAIMIGILLDKILLFRGEPNTRTESITGSLDEKINRENINDILREAEEIIRESQN